MRPAPVNPAEADDMLAEPPALGAFLAGYRGEAAADRAALADTVVRLSEIVAAVLVSPHKQVAADGRHPIMKASPTAQEGTGCQRSGCRPS